MRSSSGKGQSRNNLRDPTLRDRKLQAKQAHFTGRSTGMGSHARKNGQRGR